MKRVPPALVELHQDLNRETAERWQEYSNHRDQVTALAPGGDTLAILGAGNCNDLDLEALAARYREIHLVDLDAEALERARARQRPEVTERLVLHGSVDLSGALHRLPGFYKKTLTQGQLGALPQSSADAAVAAVGGSYDTVLSACVLSQMVHSCAQALGAETPQLQIIACALVVAHMRVVGQLVKPGGTGVIVTDTVSSDSYALEELWGERTPLQHLDELEQTENFLSGTSPSFLRRILRTDELLVKLLEPPRLVEPWLWETAEELTMMVYALVFRRRA